MRPLAFLLLLSGVAAAKNPEQPETEPQSAGQTFIDHEAPRPFWVGAEINSILQYHPSFPAAYSGPNSLRPDSEYAISGLVTVFALTPAFAGAALAAYHAWLDVSGALECPRGLSGTLSAPAESLVGPPAPSGSAVAEREDPAPQEDRRIPADQLAQAEPVRPPAA